MTLRDLPSVTSLVGRLTDESSTPHLPEVVLVEIARHAIDETRRRLVAGETGDALALARTEAAHLAALRPQRVINATGVLLHTNLGRAAIAPAAAAAAAEQMSGYGNLEFDLTSGKRGGRGAYVGRLLAAVTGAEAGLAVNNNAAALILTLAALAGGGSVAVSRGELIEIGGSFRLPEIMAVSTARLLEVGTTNRTRLADYEAVVNDVQLLLKVHPSNYRVEGFAEEATWAELGDLARRTGIGFVADVGSGLLDTRVPWVDGGPPAWLDDEPGVRQSLEAGATVVIFSGDKLLGGPQAGLIVGTEEAVTRIRKHPLARALRVDGATNAALATTLELYGSGRGGEVPFWRMASLGYEELELRHQALVEAAGIRAEVVADGSLPGAGSVPGKSIPSPAIRITGAVDDMWRSLVEAPTPIIGRRKEDALFVDLRTVDPTDDKLVAGALAELR